MNKSSATFLLLLATLSSSCLAEDKDKPAATPEKTMSKPQVTLSDEEWKKRLTEEQYRVTRTAGTERPFGKIYEEFEKQGEGTYYCVCCGAELFTSKEKFHSGCGWPSFYDASTAKNVLERPDHSHGMIRVETLCKRCGAHLGHVFDGESVSAATPTKRRFCINGVALHYVPKGGEPPKLLELGSADVEKKKEAVAKEAGVPVSKP
ncbi:MAG: peptide-methionine (R)-S-oxide reductase MsrB [Prosthecobacter sp.]|jgi:peptide-methionine (R)-S-oxide reductase|nr:peptide-methionine (R)-S-oxide reductase MsrB [Prosthecobacter sp.]